jgi:hypothetical protein
MAIPKMKLAQQGMRLYMTQISIISCHRGRRAKIIPDQTRGQSDVLRRGTTIHDSGKENERSCN